MNERRVELLQSMSIFGGVRRETLELLMPYVDQVERRRGEFFFRENDPGTNVYALETGRVVIQKHGDGRQVLLSQAGPGDCFGEVALIDFGPRTAAVQAVEDSRALEIEASDLIKVLRQDAEQFALIYMNLARELARRLRAADARIVQADVEGRIAPLPGFARPPI